jgi:predicted transcriptional regulator
MMEAIMNTIGVIAQRLGVPIHKVEYAIRSQQIKAESKAGIAKVYSDDQVEQISRALDKIKTRKNTQT